MLIVPKDKTKCKFLHQRQFHSKYVSGVLLVCSGSGCLRRMQEMSTGGREQIRISMYILKSWYLSLTNKYIYFEVTQSDFLIFFFFLMVCDQNSLMTTGLECCMMRWWTWLILLVVQFVSDCSRAEAGAHLASHLGNACFCFLTGCF